MNPFVQTLEDRRLLSASLAGGVLTVTGTTGNDNIVVSLSSDGETITVSESKARRFKRGSATPTTTTFDAADVTSLVVNANAGNDNVALKGASRSAPFALPATIDGGDGNDCISTGSGADSINGGAGDDKVFAAAGNDSVNGGDGDDDLSGGDGDDLLNGDAGDDKLVGGAGTDNLNGGADDDLLIAKDGATTDIIDGGADSAGADEDDADVAVVDTDESAANATSQTNFGWGRGGGHHHGGGFGKLFSTTSISSRRR